MKKITLLLFCLTALSGFSQSLPIDFENAEDEFTDAGSVFSIIADPTGSGRGMVGEIVGGAGQFDNVQKNLITISGGTFIDVTNMASNSISFDIYTPTATVMTGLLQLTDRETLQGGNNVPVEMGFTTNGAIGWETITLDFDSATNGFPYCSGCPSQTSVLLDQFQTIVFFTDFNATSTDTYYIDNITGTNGDAIPATCSDGVQNQDETGVDCGGVCDPCSVPPPTAATTPPARAAADVESIYSDAYSNEPTDGAPTFAGATVDGIMVDSNNTLRLTAPNAGGGFQYQFFGNPALNLTDFTHAHIDFYVEGAVQAGQQVQMIMQQFDGSNAFEHNIIYNFDVNALGAETWISGDIEIANFTGGGLSRNSIKQVQIVAAGPAAFGPIYIDNIYFHKNTVLSTEDNSLSEVKIFPNPTEDKWSIITQNEQIESINVFDVLGKEVIRMTPKAVEVSIDASTLKSGIYFAQVKLKNGLSTLRLVKK